MSARSGSLGVLLLAAALGSCRTITYDAVTLEQMVAMNRATAARPYERVDTFERKRRAVFLVADLITVMDAELEEALRRELARSDGDAVVNLRIHEEYDLVDVVVGLIAGGLIGTRSITYRGDVVRWRGEGPPGELLETAQCRAIEVPTGEGDRTRTGYACVP